MASNNSPVPAAKAADKPTVTPEVTLEVTPTVTPEVTPEVQPTGPVAPKGYRIVKVSQNGGLVLEVDPSNK